MPVNAGRLGLRFENRLTRRFDSRVDARRSTKSGPGSGGPYGPAVTSLYTAFELDRRVLEAARLQGGVIRPKYYSLSRRAGPLGRKARDKANMSQGSGPTATRLFRIRLERLRFLEGRIGTP